MATWLTQLLIPMYMVRRSSRRSSRKLSRVRAMVLKHHRYRTARKKERIWPRMVASAAPNTPQWKAKIKMGSRMVLAMAPATMQVME